MLCILRKFAAALCHHGGKGPPGIMLKMPLGRDDVIQEPFQFLRIVDQLFKQTAQIPAIEDIANIEDDGINCGNGRFICHRQAISPGVP